MSESDWVAVAAVAGVVTAVATAVMAYAVVKTALSARDTLKHAREDSRARTRPMIAAEIRRDPLSGGSMMLVIRNVGASVARDVRVTFDREPPADVEAMPDADMWKWIWQRFAAPVPTWPPGWTLSNVVRAGHEELPALTVRLDYYGPEGESGERYREEFVLLPGHMLKETSSVPSKVTEGVELEQQKVSALQALVRVLNSR